MSERFLQAILSQPLHVDRIDNETHKQIAAAIRQGRGQNWIKQEFGVGQSTIDRVRDRMTTPVRGRYA